MSSFFKNYTLHWIPATKIHNAGRARGGCLYGFKKEAQKKFNLKFININSNIILNATFDQKVYHLIPKYINCTKWKAEFEQFETFVFDLNPTHFCIMGDLNARIAAEQVIDKNELQNICRVSNLRSSKDKTINSQGKKLLDVFDTIGGIVLNGRSADDAQGDFTFCGAMENSVIDYCVCSYSVLQYVDSFSVATKPFSDHMPLVLKLNVPINICNNENFTSFVKLHWNEKFALQYRQNMVNLPREPVFQYRDIPPDTLISCLTNKIKTAYNFNPKKTIFIPKQKWFNWKCFRLRTSMLKNLKSFRKSHTSIKRNIYNSSRSKYLAYCENKKLDYYNNNISKLGTVKCSKHWWSIAKSLKKKSKNPQSTLNANSFSFHFKSLLNSSYSSPLQWCMVFKIDPFLDSPLEPFELYSAIKLLKKNKSPGPDGIPYEFFQNAPECFISDLLSIYNFIFLHETVPNAFKESIIVPLFKKGDPNLCSNYRGLSLINASCKIFNLVLLNRINEWLDNHKILNEYQAGFRKDYSTVDNIFNLVNLVKLNSLKSKYTYAFFVDFSCAFDTVPRNSLFYKLSCIGLSSKIIRVIQAMYEKSYSKVWDGNMFSDQFNVDCGVKQGCILSPVLFSLYINDLPEALPNGLNVAGLNIKVLLYADDIVLLAECPSDLQCMIDALYTYCSTWNLTVNLSKSKIMIFRKSPRAPRTLEWKFGNEAIEIVNKYTYLGVELTFNLSFKTHLENKLSAAKMAISSTWSSYISNTKISFQNKMKIFEAASQSIMFYAAQVWGFERHESVEKLFRFFIKKMIYLPSNTPNYVLYLETMHNSLFVSTLNLHFTYINRVLALDSYRLPRILAAKILESNIFWAQEWVSLCTRYNFTSPNSSLPLCHFQSNIIDVIKTNDQQRWVSDAANSQFHDLYPKLNHSFSIYTYNLSPRATSLIIKARCGMLDLNAKSFKANTYGYCTICNLDVAENTYHFVGICPVFKHYRKSFFGKEILSLEDVLLILNGSCINNLYWYLENSIKYRKLLINEFNF